MALSIAALQQMVEQNDQKNEDAHKRLRIDLRDNEQAVYELEKQIRELTVQVAKLTNAPAPDVRTLRFPLPIVISIAAGFLAIGGGIMSIKADNAELRVEMLNSNQNLKETVQRLDRQQALQYAEFQAFRQEMARAGARSKE